jgi:hypothetical protein
MNKKVLTVVISVLLIACMSIPALAARVPYKDAKPGFGNKKISYYDSGTTRTYTPKSNEQVVIYSCRGHELLVTSVVEVLKKNGTYLNGDYWRKHYILSGYDMLKVKASGAKKGYYSYIIDTTLNKLGYGDKGYCS